MTAKSAWCELDEAEATMLNPQCTHNAQAAQPTSYEPYTVMDSRLRLVRMWGGVVTKLHVLTVAS